MHVGFHVNVGECSDTKDIIKVCDTAANEIREYITEYDPCVQIFVTGPQSGKPINALAALKNADNISTKTYVHGSYVDAPWKQHTHVLRTELRLADKLGACGVIVHLAADAKLAKLSKVFDGLELTMPKPWIWLEINSAKSSPRTYETPEKLAALFDFDVPGIGLCIDTAHLFACGVSLASYEAAETWLRALQWELPNVPKLIHLNDSSTELGSGRDVHENLFYGNIWSMYKKRKHESGVMAIIDWCREHGYDIIVERGGKNKLDPVQDIRVIGELI